MGRVGLMGKRAGQPEHPTTKTRLRPAGGFIDRELVRVAGRRRAGADRRSNLRWALPFRSRTHRRPQNAGYKADSERLRQPTQRALGVKGKTGKGRS